MTWRRTIVAAALLLAGAAINVPATAALSAGDTVKIGVLNDQTGMNADLSGQGSVIAARMAAEDAGGTDRPDGAVGVELAEQQAHQADAHGGRAGDDRA